MKTEATKLLDELESMHLQWFADAEEEPEMEFEDDDDEPEIVVLRPGESPPRAEDEEEEKEDPEKVALQQKIAELQAQANNPEATGKAIADSLSQVLNRPVDQPQQPQQQPGESEEEFAKRFAKQVWKPGEEYNAIKEAVLKLVGPIAQSTIGATVEQSKELLRMNPDKGHLFKRFEKEIEQERNSLPWAQKNDPKVYSRLLDQVVAKHPEVQEEQISARVQTEVERVLKEKYGIDPNSDTPTKATFTEGAGSRGGAPRKKKRIYATEQDKRMAGLKGMSVADYMRFKSGG